MKRVKCISKREFMPNQIEVGRFYWMDEKSKWKDEDGDEYAKIYTDELKHNYIGNLLCKHFCIPMVSQGMRIL